AFGVRNLADSGSVSGFALPLLLYFHIALGMHACPGQVGGELGVGRCCQRGDHERQNGVSQHRYPPVAFRVPAVARTYSKEQRPQDTSRRCAARCRGDPTRSGNGSTPTATAASTRLRSRRAISTARALTNRAAYRCAMTMNRSSWSVFLSTKPTR